MKIEAAAHRIRAFLNEDGVKVGRVARDAGLSWETVEMVKRGKGAPTLPTLCAIDAVIPPDYVPPDMAAPPSPAHAAE